MRSRLPFSAIRSKTAESCLDLLAGCTTWWPCRWARWFAGAGPPAAPEARVRLRARRTRHGAPPHLAEKNEAALPCGSDRPKDAGLRCNRKPHRPFAFTGDAKRRIRRSPYERSLSAVFSPRAEGLYRLPWAARDPGVQRDATL